MDSHGNDKGKKTLPEDDPWAPFYEALKRLEKTIDRLRVKDCEERDGLCPVENEKTKKENCNSLSTDNHKSFDLFSVKNSDFGKGKQSSYNYSFPQSFERSEEWLDEDYEVEIYSTCVDDPWDDEGQLNISPPEAQETNHAGFQLAGMPYHPVPAPWHLLPRNLPVSSIAALSNTSCSPPCCRQHFQMIGKAWYFSLPVPMLSHPSTSNLPSCPLPALRALAGLCEFNTDMAQVKADIESMDSLAPSSAGEVELYTREHSIHSIHQKEHGLQAEFMIADDEREDAFYPRLEEFSDIQDIYPEFIEEENALVFDDFQDSVANDDVPKPASHIEEWEGDLDDFDSDLHESPFEALAGGRYWVPFEERWEEDEAHSAQVARALDKALDIAELLSGIHSERQLVQAVAWLESFLRERAHFKTFNALVDLARRGLSFDELKKVIELREYCQEAGLSAWRYFHAMSSSWEVRWVAPTYADMLQIVRARRDFPVEDMIDHHWYDLWLHLRKGSPGFDNFIHFVLLLLEKGWTDPLSFPLQEVTEEIADKYSWPTLCRLKGVSDAWIMHLLPRAEPGHLLSHLPPRPKNDD